MVGRVVELEGPGDRTRIVAERNETVVEVPAGDDSLAAVRAGELRLVDRAGATSTSVEMRWSFRSWV